MTQYWAICGWIPKKVTIALGLKLKWVKKQQVFTVQVRVRPSVGVLDGASDWDAVTSQGDD